MLPSLLVLLTGAVVGCGDDDPESAPSTGPLTVTAVDYAYEGLADEVAAGTEIALVNESRREVHEFVAVRLDDDETRSVEELVQLPPEELGALFAGVEAVIVAPPNSDGFTVEGDGTLGSPGRYAIVCVIPTGANPDEYLAAAAEAEGGPPDVAGGPPHIAAGMFAELVVT